MTLTVEVVEAELRRLAREHPDVVYPVPLNGGCTYANGEVAGGVGCIFGQALQNLGVPIKTLREIDQGCAGSRGIYFAAKGFGLSAPTTWQQLQDCQDRGETWGAAIQKLDH